MKSRVLVVSCLVAGMLLALQVGAGEKGAPLTDQHKMMMKNGAMKNMDKYMGSQEAMMKELPKAMMSKQKSLVMNGKALFSDTGLGANGQSCASCHPGGGTVGGTVDTPMASELTGKPYSLPVPSLIGAAATFPKFKVPNDRVITVHEMANNCVMMFMGAVPPEIGSPDSNAIGAYLYSLSAGEPVEPGKMPEMMKKMMEGGMGDMGAGS